jgi:hypothetical protein
MGKDDDMDLGTNKQDEGMDPNTNQDQSQEDLSEELDEY